jgi:hypothetical protein
MVSPPLYHGQGKLYCEVCAIILLLSLVTGAALQADPPLQFREHPVAGDLKGGYQVVAVDMNKDGRLDLIALGSQMAELVWFENPGWQRHVIATNLNRMINLAPVNSGGDGIPELVLASEFSMEPAKSIGALWMLKHKGDPRQPWSITEIDRLPTSHRLRAADIEGTGTKVVVNVPLAGSQATPPDYRDKVPIVLYRPGVWKRELISDELEGVVHGVTITDWDGDGLDEILTASFQGIHLFRLEKGGHWRMTRLAQGNPEPWPKSGSSEIAVGSLGKQRFLCAIEPWHGNQVVVYRQRGEDWQRTVIDDTLTQGHALLTADFNADGLDEIVAGDRGGKGGVYIYSAADPTGARWTRHVLDAGLPASSCATTDLNADGRPDLACLGASTLKWYENPATQRPR